MKTIKKKKKTKARGNNVPNCEKQDPTRDPTPYIR